MGRKHFELGNLETYLFLIAQFKIQNVFCILQFRGIMNYTIRNIFRFENVLYIDYIIWKYVLDYVI